MCYSGTCYFEDCMGNCGFYDNSSDRLTYKYGLHHCELGGFMSEESEICNEEQKYAKQRLNDYIRDTKELKHRADCLRKLRSLSEELAKKGLKDGT